MRCRFYSHTDLYVLHRICVDPGYAVPEGCGRRQRREQQCLAFGEQLRIFLIHHALRVRAGVAGAETVVPVAGVIVTIAAVVCRCSCRCIIADIVYGYCATDVVCRCCVAYIVAVVAGVICG